jgi:hypothetical protein
VEARYDTRTRATANAGIMLIPDSSNKRARAPVSNF